MMASKVQFKSSGNDVQPGDKITSFRGEYWYFRDLARAGEPGRSAKVEVTSPFGGVQLLNIEVFPDLAEALEDERPTGAGQVVEDVVSGIRGITTTEVHKRTGNIGVMFIGGPYDVRVPLDGVRRVVKL